MGNASSYGMFNNPTTAYLSNGKGIHIWGGSTCVADSTSPNDKMMARRGNLLLHELSP